MDPKDSGLASIAAGATSLNRIAGRGIDRDELVGELLRNIGTWNAMLASQEGRPHCRSGVPRRLCDDRARGPCRARWTRP